MSIRGKRVPTMQNVAKTHLIQSTESNRRLKRALHPGKSEQNFNPNTPVLVQSVTVGDRLSITIACLSQNRLSVVYEVK